MRPGDVMPEHRDTYRRFCDLYRVTDPESVQRYVVFLEPWQSGHYFEISNSPILSWQIGDWISWNGSVPHLAANLGRTDRYTLQITGLPRAIHV